MQIEMSLEEARELKDLTSEIVANLKYIEANKPSDTSLAEILESTTSIAANLKYIEENQ